MAVLNLVQITGWLSSIRFKSILISAFVSTASWDDVPLSDCSCLLLKTWNVYFFQIRKGRAKYSVFPSPQGFRGEGGNSMGGGGTSVVHGGGGGLWKKCRHFSFLQLPTWRQFMHFPFINLALFSSRNAKIVCTFFRRTHVFLYFVLHFNDNESVTLN